MEDKYSNNSYNKYLKYKLKYLNLKNNYNVAPNIPNPISNTAIHPISAPTIPNPVTNKPIMINNI
jgi:hypothetical protein